MFRIKSTLSLLVVMSAIVGLVFVIGCGSSEEKLKMSDLLQEFSKTVDEFTDALNKSDTAKKAEIEEKLKSFEHRWADMKMKMADQITPQALDELDHDFKKISEKYKSLAGKS